MLQLTSNAISVIAALAERQEPPDAAGLRIARTEDDSGKIGFYVAPQPPRPAP